MPKTVSHCGKWHAQNSFSLFPCVKSNKKHITFIGRNFYSKIKTKWWKQDTLCDNFGWFQLSPTSNFKYSLSCHVNPPLLPWKAYILKSYILHWDCSYLCRGLFNIYPPLNSVTFFRFHLVLYTMSAHLCCKKQLLSWIHIYTYNNLLLGNLA